MHSETAYVALGANLGDRSGQIRAAIRLLGETAGARVVRVSPLLENPSVGGPADAPAFLNAVAAVECSTGPEPLLDRLLEIEVSLGRVRSRKNDPRPIDLDLILYGDQILETARLTLPHPLMHERRFVLQPLAEIAPDVVHPALGWNVRNLLARLDQRPRDRELA